MMKQKATVQKNRPTGRPSLYRCGSSLNQLFILLHIILKSYKFKYNKESIYISNACDLIGYYPCGEFMKLRS